MFHASSAFRPALVGGIALISVIGLPGRALAQGAVGGGQLIEVLARAFMVAEAERVNINMAPAAELEKRLGLEEATATRIVTGRPYTSVRDLARVGVSAETIQRIKPLVTVGLMPGWRRVMLGRRGPSPSEVAPPDREALVRWMVFRDILFDFDKAEVRTTEVAKIKDIVEILKRELNVTVRLDGSADLRGSKVHNLQLSDRRVRAVQDALAAQGIAAPRVRIASTVELGRSCAESTEACYQQNRRVEVQLRTAN